MPNPKVRTLTISGVTYDLQDNISGYITGITSSDVTTALGFTPYNATNPNGYTSNTGTITSVKTTAGAHTTINVSSGAANFNVPTKTSHLTNDSNYITTQYIENKTDYEIPVSRVGEIVVGETAIGTDSTNFPTSKAVVDYVDERVVQEIDAIDVGVTGIQANGTSLSVVKGVVNIPAIGPNQSIGLMTQNVLDSFTNYIQNQIPTSTSQLTNDSNFTVKSTTTATLTTTWSSKTQTVSVTGVTASNTVIITPAPASYNAYCEYGVYCSAQSSGTLTFTCDEVPTSALTVNVLILN